MRDMRDAILSVIGGLAIAALIITLAIKPSDQPRPKFVVVDHYKSCDVVRYTDSTTRWNYFLDCSK